MIGGRQDRVEDYEGILKLCDELKVSAHPAMNIDFREDAIVMLRAELFALPRILLHKVAGI